MLQEKKLGEMRSSIVRCEDVRQYFQQYRFEHITNFEDIRGMLSSFCANGHGKQLEEYLQSSALKDDNDDTSKVYLIINNQREVVAYFAIRCGLLFEPLNYEKLNDNDKEIVDMFMDAMRKKDFKLLEEYMESGLVPDDKIEKFKKMAQTQIDIIEEQNRLKDDSFRVSISHPAIELIQFCRNSAVQLHDSSIDGMQDIPIGMGLFWEIVVPIVCNITKDVGCEYLYLFAADNTNGEPSLEKRNLVQYYRTNLKFDYASGLFFVKPTYDYNCLPMYQHISNLRENYEGIWEEFLGEISE